MNYHPCTTSTARCTTSIRRVGFMASFGSCKRDLLDPEVT